ncbi:hypothetical protein ACFSO0_08225 [Brevibacillus sp. GCM10020057]|uniref:hypothetical protein n=1 Tax=Brevibacillus sp. GCM10020057 TaxID=3317327 RepID=UPI0036414F90
MTPEQLRALYQQRHQMAVRQMQQRPAARPLTPLPKSGPVHNVKPYVQPKKSGGCCGRRWQG